MKKSSKNIAPIRLLAVAPSQYGKTYQVVHWILKLLHNKEWSPRRVIIISPTAKTDESMRPLVEYCSSHYNKFVEQNMMDRIDEDFLDMLYESQKEIKESNAKKLKQWLIIIDDSISDDAMSAKKGPLLKIATSGRHFGISTCQMLQSYRNAQNPLVRAQTSCMLLGRLNNFSQVQDIAEEFSTGLGCTKKECVQEFMRLAEQCWSSQDNHGFIVIWPYRQMGTGRLQKNLDGPFLDK